MRKNQTFHVKHVLTCRNRALQVELDVTGSRFNSLPGLIQADR